MALEGFEQVELCQHERVLTMSINLLVATMIWIGLISAEFLTQGFQPSLFAEASR